ncbi:MAG TPA: hypothetical protein PLB91_08880 [Spirochaetales bacterium]|nr:hypothetical protein [Spirochaetales bacterium]HRY54431.1 hypothetical protein [Spirochaetia bacterium]
MNKTILIAPFDGPLASALAAEARGAGWSVALALPAGRGAAPVPGGEMEEGPPERAGAAAGTVALAYDPESFVSAAALVASAVNALGDIYAAVLVDAPAATGIDLASCKPGELGAFAAARCSGPLYLVRELARRFESRGGGRILLLAPERPRDASPGPAAAMAQGAFEGLGRGLFAAAAGAPWSAFGLVDASGQPDRAARRALSLLEDPKAPKAGAWLRYTGKGGLFG